MFSKPTQIEEILRSIRVDDKDMEIEYCIKSTDLLDDPSLKKDIDNVYLEQQKYLDMDRYFTADFKKIYELNSMLDETEYKEDDYYKILYELMSYCDILHSYMKRLIPGYTKREYCDFERKCEITRMEYLIGVLSEDQFHIKIGLYVEDFNKREDEYEELKKKYIEGKMSGIQFYKESSILYGY